MSKYSININKTNIFLLILAALFIFYGINRGENIIIFQKAKVICMECIGIE